MDKKIIGMKRRQFQATAIDVIFWVTALAVVLFINISPQALTATNPVFLILFLIAMLVILLSNFLPKISQRRFRAFFSIAVLIVISFAIFLFFRGGSTWLIHYYLPITIALTMAFVIIVQPNPSITMLIAVCTFLLGEAFWNIQISTGKKLIFPTAFLRVYSLSLVTMFSYYLYNREKQARIELRFLNERLKIADDMKSEFVANVSHELRTPLTSIKNACVLLKKMDEKKDAGAGTSTIELLDIIDSNVDRQSRLINDLLDLAKIEKGRTQALRSLVDIGILARQVASGLKMQAKAKGVKLNVDIQPDLPKVYASGDQICEVYTNLIDNAIKYTASGGFVSVKITTDKDGIKSIVADTGVGIKEDDIDKLFDRFKRLGAILEHKIKGAGLGLAITKEIIESHGGRIWVESKVGEGSKFIFIIPIGLRKIDKDKR